MASYLTESMQASREKGVKKYLKKRKAEFIEAISEHQATQKRILKPYKRLSQKAVPKFKKRENSLNSPKSAQNKHTRKPIPKFSAKRAAQNREYLKLRTQFLKDHPNCEIYPFMKATTIHHKRGRNGNRLTDTRYFMAVSMEAHQLIENHPKWAYEMGYSLKRLAK